MAGLRLITHPRDLDDHQAAAALRRLRDGQRVADRDFIFHADIAFRVAGRSLDEGHVRTRHLVFEAPFAVDDDLLHHHAPALFVQLVSVVLRIHEQVQAAVRNDVVLAARRRADRVRHGAEGQVVGLQSVFQDHPGDLRRRSEVAQHHGLHRAQARDLLAHVSRLPAAQPGAAVQFQVLRVAGGLIALVQGGGELLRVDDAEEVVVDDAGAVPDPGDGFCGGNELRHTVSLSGGRRRPSLRLICCYFTHSAPLSSASRFSGISLAFFCPSFSSSASRIVSISTHLDLPR